jgi:hypothetical protein
MTREYPDNPNFPTENLYHAAFKLLHGDTSHNCYFSWSKSINMLINDQTSRC